MLKGFTIGGFRNFRNPPQWISPLSRINIFVGANNSGKSNILRYIQKILIPSFDANGRTNPLTGIDKNEHGGNGPPWIQVEIPFDPNPSQLNLQNLRHDHLVGGLQGFLSETQDSLIASIMFPRAEGGRAFPISHFPPSRPNGSIQILWNAISGAGGGGYAEHWYPGVANWVTSRAMLDRSCHYIQTFRSLATRLPEFEAEYAKASGQHLIDDLAQIERPGWNNQERKADFSKLEDFLRTLLEDSEVKIEISSDRTHVIVHMDNKAIPLEALGSGILEVFMLAAEIVLRNDSIILLEEPETHLHPTLQRKLMLFLSTQTSSQIFITTHSSVVIDTIGANIFGVYSDISGATVTPLLTNQQKFIACRNLGYKASDLLQSNCVIWVEGPSDRIYLSAWLREMDSSLIEGVHFSVMFYGGRLLSHLTVEDAYEGELIELLPINRKCAILLDSDKGNSLQPIRPTKQRAIDEVEKVGGLAWLTEGREIENYYSASDRDEAIRSIHKNVSKTDVTGNRFSKPLSYWRSSDKEDRTANKIAIAEWLVAQKHPVFDKLDFKKSMNDIINFISDSNQ